MSSKKVKKNNNDLKTPIIMIVAVVLIGLAVALALLIGEGGCEGDGKYVSSPDDKYTLSDFVKSDEETDFVKITVKGYGSMIVELYPDTAPITVKNYKELVSSKFYDGLTFHRIMKGFMIQGGDDGTGGSDKKIKGEFSLNGVANDLSHTRGVISMARSRDIKDSASCQFFICDSDKYKTTLDGSYAAFGKVVSGYAVLDDIASTPVGYSSTGEASSPVETVRITSISFVKLK